jgi:hypothetical protein
MVQIILCYHITLQLSFISILFLFQWLSQPIQVLDLLISSVIIFHRRKDFLDKWSARRKDST